MIKDGDADKALADVKTKKFSDDHGEEKNPPEGKIFLFKFEGEEDVVYQAEVKNGRFEWNTDPYDPYEVIEFNQSGISESCAKRPDGSFAFYNVWQNNGYIFIVDKEAKSTVPIFVRREDNGSVKVVGKNPIEFAKRLIESSGQNYEDFCKARYDDTVAEFKSYKGSPIFIPLYGQTLTEEKVYKNAALLINGIFWNKKDNKFKTTIPISTVAKFKEDKQYDDQPLPEEYKSGFGIAKYNTPPFQRSFRLVQFVQEELRDLNQYIESEDLRSIFEIPEKSDFYKKIIKKANKIPVIYINDDGPKSYPKAEDIKFMDASCLDPIKESKLYYYQTDKSYPLTSKRVFLFYEENGMTKVARANYIDAVINDKEQIEVLTRLYNARARIESKGLDYDQYCAEVKKILQGIPNQP